jgi:radical SAM superfamily enzyme YgiQ (UPF0313 family)
MKILFIYPDVGTMLPRDYQHGIGSIMAVLKQAGHECSLVYAHRELGEEELVEEARRFGPGLAAVSTVTNQYPRARRYALWIKESLGLPIVVGGAHATLAPEEAIAEPCFDMLCRGEGELAMKELAEAMEAGRDYAGIENLWVKRGGAVVRNPLRPLISDLDSLPFADREAFGFEEILSEQAGKCSMLCGRGCPFGCAYCANRGLSELYRGKGKYTRWRSVSKVLAEMRELLERYAVRKWRFNDDIFTLKREWFYEFCESYKKEFTLPFDINVHVETVDAEMLKAAREAGCDGVRVGVESGSARVRSEIMGRPMEDDRIVKVFREAEAAGLETWSFNMVGLPGETEADAEETYKLNERLCPDHMQVSVFNPYPGTRLYDVAKKRGLITGETRDGYFHPDSVLDLPEFPRERIHEMQRRLIALRDRCHAANKLRRLLGGRAPAYDFVEKLSEAEVETPEPIYVGEDYFRIGDDARKVLRLHPPARARFKVRVPKRAELRLSMAMHPQVLTRGTAGGVVFMARVGRSARKMTEILHETLDPKRVPAHRGWHDFAAPLDKWAGKDVYIEFETRAVDAEHPDHNTVGLGYPLIVEIP